METHSKYTFYKLPEALRESAELDRAAVESFEVSEQSLQSPESLGHCSVTGHSSIKCMCGSPPKPKYGACDIYTEDGTGKYCYTRCESCYVVCNKP